MTGTTKYEYKVIILESKYNSTKEIEKREKILNELGLLGWELVAVVSNDSPLMQTRAFLKRKK